MPPTGALIGTPASINDSDDEHTDAIDVEPFELTTSLSILSGIVAFFVLEKILHWHHAHFPSEEVIHPVATTNLIGDGLHNFIDGAIIASSFLASPKLGIIRGGTHQLAHALAAFLHAHGRGQLAKIAQAEPR